MRVRLHSGCLLFVFLFVSFICSSFICFLICFAKSDFKRTASKCSFTLESNKAFYNSEIILVVHLLTQRSSSAWFCIVCLCWLSFTNFKNTNAQILNQSIVIYRAQIRVYELPSSPHFPSPKPMSS